MGDTMPHISWIRCRAFSRLLGFLLGTCEGDHNPFVHLEKTTVLQEARVFNEMPISARKCIIILTKILCLVHQVCVCVRVCVCACKTAKQGVGA